MQKRLQALLLTALMVWTLAAPAMGANPFFDVPEDHWAYDAISYLAEAGLVEGYPDGTFGGSRNFTRYEMALVFARIVARFEKHVDELVDKGIQSRLEELTGEVSAATSGPSGALKVAEEASVTAGYALDVALGILDAIDAREWDARIDAAGLRTAEVARQAEAALQAAKDAQGSAQQAIDVAVGVLDAIDARGWDARLDSLEAKTNEAWNAANKAQAAAEQAVQVAAGILDAIDAREWDARIDSAARKADEALALARRLAGTEAAAPADTPLFSGAARAAIEEIAASVVMDKLASENADAKAVRALIESEASRLEKAIMDLTREFSSELEILGVRVARIESKVMAHDDEIKAIRAEMARVRVSGSNETTLVQGNLDGDTPYKDPRNPGGGEFAVPDDRAINRLQLRIDATPSDDVTLVSELDLVTDSTFWAGGPSTVLQDSRVYVEATTDYPVRVVRIGSLDAQRVAKDLSPYMLDAKRFGESSTFGAFVNIASGQAEHDVFGAQVVQTGQSVAGFSSHIQLNPQMDFAAGAVRLTDGVNSQTGVSLGSIGNMDGLNYNAAWVHDVENAAYAYKFLAEVPVESATLTAAFDRIDKVWSEAGRLPFGAEVKLQDAAKADKPADINSAIFADQRLQKARIDAPIGSFKAFAQFGLYERSSSALNPDSFSQYGVSDLDLFGFDVDVTRSRFVDASDDTKVLTDQRTNLSTRVEDLDLKVAIHKQKNSQDDALPTEAEQNHFKVTLARPVHIVVPWTGTLEFATSFTADRPTHSAYKLALNDYEFMPDLWINAEIGAENTVITDGNWRKNINWTDENRTTRAVDATWRFSEPMSILGGYKVVNSDKTGRTVTQDAGVQYQLDAFGGDLKLGYGYRIVHVDDVRDGAPRSIVNAAFTRTAGGFTLDADAKYVIGGTVDEKGNDYDTIASLRLAYPVFTGANFTVDGKYVSSQGQKLDGGGARPVFAASSLMAGLKINF